MEQVIILQKAFTIGTNMSKYIIMIKDSLQRRAFQVE